RALRHCPEAVLRPASAGDSATSDPLEPHRLPRDRARGARAGAGASHHRDDDVPRDGDDVLVGAGGGTGELNRSVEGGRDMTAPRHGQNERADARSVVSKRGLLAGRGGGRGKRGAKPGKPLQWWGGVL